MGNWKRVGVLEGAADTVSFFIGNKEEYLRKLDIAHPTRN